MSLSQDQRLEKMLHSAEQTISDGAVSEERRVFRIRSVEKILEDIKGHGIEMQSGDLTNRYHSLTRLLIEEDLKVFLDKADSCFCEGNLEQGRQYLDKAKSSSIVYGRKFLKACAGEIFESLIMERIKNGNSAEIYSSYLPLPKAGGRLNRMKTAILKLVA